MSEEGTLQHIHVVGKEILLQLFEMLSALGAEVFQHGGCVGELCGIFLAVQDAHGVAVKALVAGLGFHFRTVKLAAEDCSASMARTYDIEINIPSMNGYKEVSSVSNARDYQARRGMMRVRRADGRVEFMHTLNGSGLATSRVLPALVEQNQLADGSVVVPEVLRKYVGTDIIKK